MLSAAFLLLLASKAGILQLNGKDSFVAFEEGEAQLTATCKSKKASWIYHTVPSVIQV